MPWIAPGSPSGGGVPGSPAATVQDAVAGVASTLPGASLARTANVWAPSGRSLYARGEVHAAKAAPSRLHSKLDPVSDEVKEMLAERSATVPEGAATMVVSGAVVSPGTVVLGRYSMCRRG